MEITKTNITVKDLFEGYINDGEGGVVGYDGKLDIRPPFQREFVYDDEKRDLVIDTVLKKFPLSIMYWNIKDDGSFEILDGQQRTVSICEYVNNGFSFDGIYFDNQPDDIQERILDYELDVYQCKGTHSEKLAWFEVINVAGETLKPQEILNAIFAGPWLTDAKKRFSKTECPAYQIGNSYMAGDPIRQDYLETVLKWASDNEIKEYMGKHQYEENADELWEYYEQVIKWIRSTFGNDERKEMKGLEWGYLFDEYGDKGLDSEAIQAKVAELMEDEDVQKKSGIYSYVLDDRESHLNIRTFRKSDRRTTYEKQGGKCIKCNKKFPIEKMEADHVIPWSQGGRTELDNCQMLCKECNARKSDK